MLELNKIYCMDCLEGLKQIDDNSIDLVLTDPPYNVGLEYDGINDTQEKDVYIRWCKEWFNEVYRICKHNILIFCGNDNYFDWIVDIQKPNELIIWHRPNSMTRNNYMYSWRLIEPILFYEKHRNLKVFHDFYSVPISVQVDVGDHPCPKSLKLFKLLLKDFTDEGDTVLDPFMGSGTTAVACKQLQRKFIGFELSQKYVDIANKRLQQDTLFSYDVLQVEATE